MGGGGRRLPPGRRVRRGVPDGPAGIFDTGDLGGIPEVAFECRDRNRLTLSENVDDANERARNKGSEYGVTVMKRRGRPAADAYVALDLATFVRILQDLTKDPAPGGHH